jgi:hypothetical protein
MLELYYTHDEEEFPTFLGIRLAWDFAQLHLKC